MPSPSEYKNIVVFNIMLVECSLLSTNYSLYAFSIRSMFIFLISTFCFLFYVVFFIVLYSLQVYGLLPQNGNQIAVNKYHKSWCKVSKVE